VSESDDLRAFIREIMGRFDRKMDAIDRRFEADQAERRLYHDRLDAKADRIIADNRATHDALMHVLDKLDGGGPAAAT
jgi:RNase H-fold protein (predicted Holliday junction resolvase)